MRQLLWRVGFVALLCASALAAACSGGGRDGLTPQPGEPPSQQTGYIHTKLFVPKKHRDRLAHLLAQALQPRSRLRGHYLPATTSEVDFTLVSVSGIPAGTSAYNFTVSTTGSDCTASGAGANAGFVCSVTKAAPAGSDVFQVVAKGCTSYGSPPDAARLRPDQYCLSQGAVSESLVTINVPPGGNANAGFTLNPVVASLGWSVGTGPHAPVYSNGTYSCTYGTGGCYDPLFNYRNEPAAHAVTLNAYDATGSLIVPASAGGSVYDTPIYLQSNGNADSIGWNCNDPSLQWETGGGPFQPYDTGMTLANGESATPGLRKRGGAAYRSQVRMHGQISSLITSPVASPSPATGLDFSGNVVTAVGNNGAQMNYDGNYGYYASLPLQCLAFDSQGNQATYYAGDDLIHIEVYVANAGNGTVSAIDALSGTPQYGTLDYTLSFGGFYGPQSLAVDGGGNLFVADYSAGAVYV